MPVVRRPSTVPVAEGGGVVRHVPLAEWRTEVLPEELKRCWTEPDALARVIECAIEASLHADVAVAAEHLARIDPDRNRRYGLPAIVLARNGQIRRAEELLDRHSGLFGDSAYGFYARGEVALSGNRRARGLDMLWQSLELDPGASRPLRRYVDELSKVSLETAVEGVRAIAARPGGWRARLWLAENGAESDGEVAKLVADAIDDAGDAIAVASSVLARRGGARDLAEIIAGRYDVARDPIDCGVNVLYGHLALGNREEGEALLDRLAPRLEEAEGLREYASFYRAALHDLGGGAPKTANAELVRAIAAAARLGSSKARRRSWQLLLEASLLVPVARVWMEVPVFGSPWPSARRPLEMVTGVDSEGREVAIAFTDEKALGAWGPMKVRCVAMTARGLVGILLEDKGCALLVNPAGPTATELAPPDMAALVEGRDPSGEPSEIRFLAEPVRRDVPREFLDSAGAWLRRWRIVREAWLFEIVDDRLGVSPAVAIDFTEEADERDRREVLIDAADEVHWKDRRSRRVRFTPLSEGRLADYIRAVAIRIV